jgi:hypothetical protein
MNCKTCGADMPNCNGSVLVNTQCQKCFNKTIARGSHYEGDFMKPEGSTGYNGREPKKARRTA